MRAHYNDCNNNKNNNNDDDKKTTTDAVNRSIRTTAEDAYTHN